MSGGIDWRPSPGYARRGGLYAVEYHNYADRDTTYSFDRFDGEIVQHIPILRENWVLSLRGQLQTTIDDNEVVPYFLLPALGSGSTLRAYSSWRFRDRHSELFSVEWRWIPNRFGLDMALFYDAGKVTAQRSHLDFRGLKSNVGIGPRFHGPATTPLRIEVAAQGRDIDLLFDLSTDLFGRPGDPTENVRAMNINTIDEVPNSNWFTNRIFARPLSVEEAARGPVAGPGPAPGIWTIVAPKRSGIAPGFTMRDSRGELWFVSFSFDNATGETRSIGQTTDATLRLRAPANLPAAPGTFIKVELSAAGGPNPAWEAPVHAYFRQIDGGWRLVGFERLPQDETMAKRKN